MFTSDHPILHDAVIEILPGTRSFVKGKMLEYPSSCFLNFSPYCPIYVLFLNEVHGIHDGMHCSGTLGRAPAFSLLSLVVVKNSPVTQPHIFL